MNCETLISHSRSPRWCGPLISNHDVQNTYSSYGHEDVHCSGPHCDVLDVILLDSCSAVNAVCVIVDLGKGGNRSWTIISNGQVGVLRTLAQGQQDTWTSRSCSTHRIDPRQLLAHVHNDDGDQLPAQRALGQQGEHGQVTFSSFGLVLQMHLWQLCIHIVPATKTLQRWEDE